MLPIITYAALVLFITMTCVFVLALILRDNSIVDIFYGPAFVVAAGAAYLKFATWQPRQILLLTLLTMWGVRLGSHLLVRHRGRGEDFRYRQWRESWGRSFVWRSFLQIYMLQGTVILVVLTPVLIVLHDPGCDLWALDAAGAAVWLLGFTFESVGDWQLLRFKRDPANRGQIMTRGLWSTTRHPNYFGEATLWWGILLIALAVPWGWVAIISPLTIDFLLLFVSGIPMLEKRYEGNPEFESYRRRTNTFFPWFPRPEGPEPPGGPGSSND
jgi:steroid 5-alpha reductase family enzyme